MTVLEEMNEQNPDPPTVIYRMWFTVAVRIALGVLIKHKGYQVPAIERHSHYGGVVTILISNLLPTNFKKPYDMLKQQQA